MRMVHTVKTLLLSFLFCLVCLNGYCGLTKGTNCGFVTSAPSADPNTGVTEITDAKAVALKDTTPSDVTGITEIGFWLDSATIQTGEDWTIALFNHDAGNDEPNVRLFVGTPTDINNQVEVWKSESGVGFSPDASTTYWIAEHITSMTGTANVDIESSAGDRYSEDPSASMPSPWGVATNTDDFLVAIYAVVSVAGVARRIIMVQ